MFNENEVKLRMEKAIENLEKFYFLLFRINLFIFFLFFIKNRQQTAACHPQTL